MTISPEELAAFADGELDAAREAELAAAIAADPDLTRQLEAHRALKAMLAGHYAPIAAQPVPDRLTAMLAKPAQADVIDLAAAREKRTLPRWTWVAAPALAASLALAIVLPGGGDGASPYAGSELASVLDSRLVESQDAQAETRVLLSFRTGGGDLCRAFAAPDGGGIACRDEKGWRLEAVGAGSKAATTDYRMAGAGDGEIFARAQQMATGPALDAEAEAAARARGWR